ncbi:MAG: hypothetical protein WC110_10465, partial [Bacteroidales bacterium]
TKNTAKVPNICKFSIYGGFLSTKARICLIELIFLPQIPFLGNSKIGANNDYCKIFVGGCL